MEILVEKREELLITAYVVFEKQCPWISQSSYNLCEAKKIVKTQTMFPTMDQNAEILSGDLNGRFSGSWMYWLFMNLDCRVSFLNNPAPELGFYF